MRSATQAVIIVAAKRQLSVFATVLLWVSIMCQRSNQHRYPGPVPRGFPLPAFQGIDACAEVCFATTIPSSRRRHAREFVHIRANSFKCRSEASALVGQRVVVNRP
jgi:hypothetical protein